MPLYEYFCHDCRTTFSERRSFTEAGDEAMCPNCESAHTRKVIAAVAFISNGKQPAVGSAGKLPAPTSSSGCGCGSCGCGAH